jgi:enoyl reductase
VALSVVFDEYGGPQVLRTAEVPVPTAGPGRVRVRVRAAGVNPVDCKLRRGEFARVVPAHFPQTLGNEFSGVVDEVGPDVRAVAPGDEVLGFTSMAAYGQYVVVPANAVTAKPAGLSWEVAGCLSAAGQTAYEALRELDVAAGETLLVHAAAGGVGTMAVQLARYLGARVVGTASERNHGYLRELGAVPVTYGYGLVDRVREAAPQGVDAALDLIGGEAIPASVEIVGDLTRIGTTVDQQAAERHGILRLRGTRSAALLAELAGLAGTGELALPIARSFPLRDAADAHREVEGGHVRGKVVLVVD